MVVADGKVLAMARQTPLFAVLATFLVLGIATMFWSAPRIQANVNQELTDRLVSAGITDAQVITRGRMSTVYGTAPDPATLEQALRSASAFWGNGAPLDSEMVVASAQKATLSGSEMAPATTSPQTVSTLGDADQPDQLAVARATLAEAATTRLELSVAHQRALAVEQDAQSAYQAARASISREAVRQYLASAATARLKLEDALNAALTRESEAKRAFEQLSGRDTDEQPGTDDEPTEQVAPWLPSDDFVATAQSCATAAKEIQSSSPAIAFDPQTADLLPPALGTIEQLAAMVDLCFAQGSLVLTIEAHTDMAETETGNRALSLAQAERVRMALGERGITAERMFVIGFGGAVLDAGRDSQPDNSGETRLTFAFR